MSRIVVVSGGGTGIGRAVAAAFAADGDQVVIVGRREDVLKRSADGINRAVDRSAVESHAADLTDAAQVEELADRLPTVDVIVNNAGTGIFGPTPTLPDVAAAWHRQLDSNVLTAVLLTSALMPKLTRPGGRIVSISS